MPHYFDTDENEPIRVVNGAANGITPLIIDTNRERSNGNLVEVRKTGQNQLVITKDGGIQIGPKASGFWNSDDNSYINYSRVDAGGPEYIGFYNTIHQTSSIGTGASFEADINNNGCSIYARRFYRNSAGEDKESRVSYVVTPGTNDCFFYGQAGDNFLYEFRPCTDSSTHCYSFNSNTKHTQGHLLQVANSGTNVFKVGVSGEIVLTPMTKAMRSGLTPASGMMIFQQDAIPGLRVYNGTNWVRYTETND